MVCYSCTSDLILLHATVQHSLIQPEIYCEKVLIIAAFDVHGCISEAANRQVQSS